VLGGAVAMAHERSLRAPRSLVTVPLVIALVFALAGVAMAAPGGKPGGKDTTLVGAWLFDEGTGDIAYDRTRNGNDGVISGATWTKGRIAGALAFDGLTDRVVVPRSALLEPASITTALWFRSSASPGGYRVLMFKAVTDCLASSYSLKTDSSGAGIVFMIGAVGGGNPVTPVATGVWDGRWHHVAGTYDGATMSLYLDGALVGSTPMTSGIRYGGFLNGDYLGIGHPVNLCSQMTQFTGDIDEVRIYSRALTASEVLSLATPKGGRK
jgi:hypothetical protein